jgi:hypothetical protein
MTEWPLLIRRSFGIPDLIGPDIGTLPLYHRLRDKAGNPDFVGDSQNDAAKTVVDMFVALANDGFLDGLLIDLPATTDGWDPEPQKYQAVTTIMQSRR